MKPLFLFFLLILNTPSRAQNLTPEQIDLAVQLHADMKNPPESFMPIYRIAYGGWDVPAFEFLQRVDLGATDADNLPAVLHAFHEDYEKKLYGSDPSYVPLARRVALLRQIFPSVQNFWDLRWLYDSDSTRAAAFAKSAAAYLKKRLN